MDGPITEAEKLRQRAERAEAAHSEVSTLLDACRENREIAEIAVERITWERDAALERVAELEGIAGRLQERIVEERDRFCAAEGWGRR